MNWLDLVIVAVIASGLFGGLRRGLMRQLIDLGGLLIAFFVAFRYGAAMGDLLSGFFNLEEYAAGLDIPVLEPSNVAQVLYNAMGYVLIFIIVLIALRILTMMLGAVAKLPVIGAVDKFAGLAVGLVKGILLALVAVWLLDFLPIPSVEDTVANSGISQVLLNIAPGIYQRLRETLGTGLLQAMKLVFK